METVTPPLDPRRALKPQPTTLRFLALCMTVLAGYVDALGYLALGGLFVSFMSGNSTRLAIDLSADGRVAWTAAALVALFVVGVMLASVASRVAAHLAARRAAVVLFLVAALLALGAALADAGQPRTAIACLTLAMGAENVALARDDTGLGLTYITGTLVKLGQRLVDAVAGEARWAWVWYLCLWLGLVVGAAIGAASYQGFGLDAAWFAAVAALLLGGVASVSTTSTARASAGA